MEPYKIVYRGGEGEYDEKKSRFIARILPVSSEEEALKLIAAARKQYWDARHNCYAYTLGKKQELQRFSDDGEPGGTAGRPILETLLKNGLHNCLAIVTRYFGGILLGAGGLARAYQKAVLAGLEDSSVAEVKEGTLLTVTCDYNGIGKLQYLIGKHRYAAPDTRYAEEVQTDVIVPCAELAGFLTEVKDATGGRVRTEETETTEFAMAEGDVLLFRDGAWRRAGK